MGRSPTSWLNQPDQFDWFSAYIRERDGQTLWRAATVIFTLTLAATPAALLWSPTGPDHPLTIVVSVAAAAIGAAAGGLWLFRWPTRRQSMLFGMAATLCIAATCLSQSNPYSSLMGSTTFAVIGGFVAYFHTVGSVAAVFGTAMLTAAISAFRLMSSTGDLALTASSFLIVLALNAGVPFGIHALARALTSDLRDSGHDPLTGLLNRQAFHQSAYELLMRHTDPRVAHLVIALVDLDDFKRLNDTQGHSVGDEALAGVGKALRDTCRDTAVIGRLGGEEFVVAECHTTVDPAAMAERIRHAISAIPFPVTASVGTANARLTDAGPATPDLIDRLIRIADAAMYDAKRAGGNRVSHRVD